MQSLMWLFLGVLSGLFADERQQIYSGMPIDDDLADLRVEIIPVERVRDVSTVELVVPGLGTVRLSATVLEDGSSRVEGEFPVEGAGVALGLLQLDSGRFEMLPDGALSYQGRGAIAGTAVRVSLARLLFLTEEDKETAGSLRSSPSGSLAIKEAVFSVRPENGFFAISVGEQALFQLREAQLVFEYKKSPYLKFFIELGGQRVEARAALRAQDNAVQVTLLGEKIDPFALVPHGRALFAGLPIETLKFSGKVELDSATGALVEGDLFDANGNAGWNINPLFDEPIILEKFRFALDRKKGPSLEAQGQGFGSNIFFKGALEKGAGLVFQGAVKAENILAYVPWLPEDVFGALAFSGLLQWSSQKGFELTGSLVNENQMITLWGVTLREVDVEVNLAARRADIGGIFSLFDLDARATFSLAFGNELLLSCSAELINPDLREWQPPALADFLTNGALLAPFVFKELRLVAGVESKKRPVSVLKKTLQNAKSGEKTTVPLSPGKKTTLFFAVEGEAVIMGQLCRAVAMVQKASKFGFLIAAEPVGVFSLSRAFPEIFAYNPDKDNVVFQYLKNVVGGAALSDVLFVLSTLKDIEAGVEPGLNIAGSAAYVGDPRENPLFKPFFSNDSLLFALKKDGDKGIGLTVAAVIDPINFKNTVIKGAFSSGDYGVFLHLPNVEEVGLKQLSLSADFYPLAAEASVVGSCLYVAEKAQQPMKLALEASANLVDVGGSISAAGDFDLAAFLPLLMGRSVRDTLSQRIIFRDGGFEFKTTWVAIASLIEAIGSAVPTLGIGTILGGISFVVSSISSLGLSGEVEIGQLNDPLRGRFVFKGGVDVSELIFEILGEKPGGFTSLVCFLFDLLLYISTFGQKDLFLPDMRQLQEKIAQVVPLDLEKFYLKFVPLGTRIGEVVVPFGVGGSLHLKLFDKFVGADLMIDSQGAYLLAYVDPIDLWGIYRLQPSKTIGRSAQKIEQEYNAWKLPLISSSKEQSKKIALEASAHLEKGFLLGADFDVRIGDLIGGSVRARLGLGGLDLQGDFSVTIPELAQSLGVKDGALKLWLKGSQVNLDNPLLLLQQLDPKNIGLEIGFEDTLKQALIGTITGLMQNVEGQLNLAVNNVIQGVLTRAKKRELIGAEELERSFCAKVATDASFTAACLDARAKLAALRAKEFVFDRLDNAGMTLFPEALRSGILALKSLGIGVLQGGYLGISGLQTIFSIEQVVWRGTLQDLSTGKIPGFDVKFKLLGAEIVLKQVGLFDFTKSPRAWIEQLALDIAQLIVQKILEPFGDSVPRVALSWEAR